MRVRADEIAAGAAAAAAAAVAIVSPVAVAWQWPPMLAVAAVGGLAAGVALAARQADTDHRRGARWYPHPPTARRALQSAVGPGDGLDVGGVRLSRSLEVQHAHVVGLPGSGKTVMLSSILQQALARGDKVVLHDPKGDYTSTNPSGRLLGPWDARSSVWDVWQDVQTPAQMQQFAKIVIGDAGLRGENAFFYHSARILLAALLRSLPPGWGWPDLGAALAQPPAALVGAAMRGDRQILSLFPGGSGEMTTAEKNILSTLAERTQWVGYVAAAAAAPGREKISLRKWLLDNDGPPLLILNNAATASFASGPYFSLLLASAADIICGPEMPEKPAAAPGLWVILDEMPQLGPDVFPAIQKIEEIGRSRGVRVVRAQQDESQLAALVGREKSEPHLSMQGVRIYCRVSDTTAAAISRRIGEREILRYTTTAQSGAVAGKTATPEKETVINPAELTGLQITPTGPEIVLHIGDTLGKLIQPFPPKPAETRPAFVESPEFKAGPTAGNNPLTAIDEVLP